MLQPPPLHCEGFSAEYTRALVAHRLASFGSTHPIKDTLFAITCNQHQQYELHILPPGFTSETDVEVHRIGRCGAEGAILNGVHVAPTLLDLVERLHAR